MENLAKSLHILFIGDSVTDCGRDRNSATWSGHGNQLKLGDGYVFEISKLKPDWIITNMGISGNRTSDLIDRWDVDVLQQNYDLLSILIGVNDTWRAFDSNDPTSAVDFEQRYQKLIQSAIEKNKHGKIVLCTPFILPVIKVMQDWLPDLNEKINVIKELSKKYALPIVPFNNFFDDALSTYTMGELAEDGIHPTVLGHQLMAKWWLENLNQEHPEVFPQPSHT